MDLNDNLSEYLTYGAIIYLEEENTLGKAIFSEGFTTSELKLVVQLS